MLRADIISGTENLISALKESEIADTTASLFKRDDKTNAPDILRCYTNFARRAEYFSAVESALIEIFDVEFLFDYTFWSVVLTADKGQLRTPSIFEKSSRLNFVLEHAPKIVELLKRDYDDISATETKKLLSENESFSKLRVFLHEEEQISTPIRLAITLEAIDGFYSVFRDIEGDSTEELRVVSCDSGSDKSFDFLGAAKIIECVKDLIIGLWDNVVYYRENPSWTSVGACYSKLANY